MATYVKQQPVPEPSLRLKPALFWGLFLALVAIVVGAVSVLHPEARAFLWVVVAICVGGIVGLSAFFWLERIKLSIHGRSIVGSLGIATTISCLTLIGVELSQDKGPPDFSRVPIK